MNYKKIKVYFRNNHFNSETIIIIKNELKIAAYQNQVIILDYSKDIYKKTQCYSLIPERTIEDFKIDLSNIKSKLSKYILKIEIL